MPYLRFTPMPGTADTLEKGGVTHPDGTVRVPLVDTALLVGRGRHCDVVASSGKLAREDTWFEPSPEGWVARNLGNNQGMFVNQSKTMRAVLRDGDRVYLFGVAFVFVAEG